MVRLTWESFLQVATGRLNACRGQIPKRDGQRLDRHRPFRFQQQVEDPIAATARFHVGRLVHRLRI